MRKKILAIMLCVFSALALCGCGSVNYYLGVDTSTGVVTQQISIAVSRLDIEQSGKTASELFNQIQSVSNQVVKNSIESFETSHNMTDVLKTYNGEEKTFAEIYAYTLNNMDPKGSTKSAKVEMHASSYNSDTIVYTISLRFLTLQAYNYFNDVYPDTEVEDTSVTESHLFFNKIITTQNSPYYNLKNNSIAKYFDEYFGDYYSLSDMKYYFSYSTPDQKLYSDATQVATDANGNSVHIWQFSASDLEAENGGKITTYKIKVKAYMWYMFALVVSLACSVVLYLICVAKQNKQKNQVNYTPSQKAE